MAEYLKLPLNEKEVRSLHIRDKVYISGTIYTARDAAHKFMLSQKSDFPIDLSGGVIYHCGPIAIKDGDEWKVTAAGPTTSSRLESFTPEVIEKYGIRAIIGKGGLMKKTLEACSEYGCVYLSAVGGCAQVLAAAIKSVKNVYFYNEFGPPEAVWELEVENFPAIVTMDSHGNSMH